MAQGSSGPAWRQPRVLCSPGGGVGSKGGRSCKLSRRKNLLTGKTLKMEQPLGKWGVVGKGDMPV